MPDVLTREAELVAAEAHRALMLKTKRTGLTWSDPLNELAAALAAAQAVIVGAVKDSENPFFKSSYPDLASVWDACRLPLSTNGIAVIQSPSTEGARVSVDTLLAHTSGQWVHGSVSVTAKEDSPQAVGSAITYLRRYALQSFAGIAPIDDDGEAAHGRGNNGHTATPTPMSATVPTVAVSGGATPSAVRGETHGPSDTVALYPPGVVLIERVDESPTKNPAVTRYLITTSSGEQLSTIKDQLAKDARTFQETREPVIVKGKPTKWGLDLESLARVSDPSAPF